MEGIEKGGVDNINVLLVRDEPISVLCFKFGVVYLYLGGEERKGEMGCCSDRVLVQEAVIKGDAWGWGDRGRGRGCMPQGGFECGKDKFMVAVEGEEGVSYDGACMEEVEVVCGH